MRPAGGPNGSRSLKTAADSGAPTQRFTYSMDRRLSMTIVFMNMSRKAHGRSEDIVRNTGRNRCRAAEYFHFFYREHPMKFNCVLTLLAASTASVAAMAAEPNIEPGMWETTSTVTIHSEQMPIPPRTDTSSECVTAEKIAEGQAFLQDSDECEFIDKEIRAEGMDYSMTCTSPQGGTVTMNASMQFGGDSMAGTIDGDIESPMGVMRMNVEMAGRRTGDCPGE